MNSTTTIKVNEPMPKRKQRQRRDPLLIMVMAGLIGSLAGQIETLVQFIAFMAFAAALAAVILWF